MKLSDSTVPNSYDEIYDYLLLFWYKEQLQKAMLKGYFRTYRTYRNNDDRLRGSIDVSRHIKQNMGQSNGKISYSYRENTIDNYLNMLIVAAYKHLKKRYCDLVKNNIDNQIELKQIIEFLDSKTCLLDYNPTIINKNIKKISHPYYTEYEQLRMTCLKILRDESIGFFDANSPQEIKGILFYLPDLWELFLKDEVLSDAIPEDTRIKYQELIENFGYETEEGYDYKQVTYPDYVFYIQNRPYMILDAKCKPKWEGVFDGHSVSDVMEDYNKCLRDMVALSVHGTGVIFPTNRDEKPCSKVLRHRISRFNTTDVFYTIPITVPIVEEGESYTEWSGKFMEIIEVIVSIIKEILSEMEVAGHGGQ